MARTLVLRVSHVGARDGRCEPPARPAAIPRQGRAHQRSISFDLRTVFGQHDLCGLQRAPIRPLHDHGYLFDYALVLGYCWRGERKRERTEAQRERERGTERRGAQRDSETVRERARLAAVRMQAGGTERQLKPVKEDRLKMLRGRPADSMRRRLSELQSANALLLSFLTTLPKAQLDAAPSELRAILPTAVPQTNEAGLPTRPHTVLPEGKHSAERLPVESGRPHTVLPTMPNKNRSPPADASPDAPPALLSAVLPSLMQSTPQPAAKKQQAGTSLVHGEGEGLFSERKERNREEDFLRGVVSKATPSSEVKLLSSQKVPQLNMHSLDELRKDLFSPATAAAHGLSGLEPPHTGGGVEIDDAGHLVNSTILSPVVESRAKKSSATPERNLRVVIPPTQDGSTMDRSGGEMLTPLKQARLRAREAEAEAGASLASLATPLKNLGRRTPVSANRKGNARLLVSPGSATTGGNLAPTPTRQRAPAAGRRTPDSRTRMTPKGGRLTPSGGGLITPVRGGSSPGWKRLPNDPEEEQQDANDRLQKSKKGSKSAKLKGPTRDCFMSRNGNFKTRPGTLVDSGEEAASLRKVAEERIKKADERHKQILKERQEKAARNAERIKKAEKRKAELIKKEVEAVTNPSNGLGTMRPVADVPTGRVRNNDEIPVTENHRGQTRQMTDDEQLWRQQQLNGTSTQAEAAPEECSAEEIERKRWEAEEMARVTSVRERNTGLRPELGPASGPRRGVPGGSSFNLVSPKQQLNDADKDRPAVPDEYLVPSAYDGCDCSLGDSLDPGDDHSMLAAATRYAHDEQDEDEVSEEITTAIAEMVIPSESSSQGAAAMQRLRTQWGELEFLLRGKIDPQPEPYASALGHVEDGRAALLELGRLGRTLNVRAGALLQWVLPFDNNTSIYAQWCDSKSLRPVAALSEICACCGAV